MPVREVEVKARESDAEFGKRHEGKFWDVTDGDIRVFDDDVDVYGIEHEDDVAAGKPRRRLLAKFRKGVFSTSQIQNGWDAFRLLAIPSRNRGAAAGPIDLSNVYWKRRKPVDVKGWGARYMREGKTSRMIVNNTVSSGVIGYYEKTPFLGKPCRLTDYSRRRLKYYLHGISFLEAIDAQFKRLVPTAHAKQLAAVKAHPSYRIGDTAFSTLTLNQNFRTALHKDAGDFKDGFGNLTVIEWGRYHGGETVFPRFGVAFDLRTGDFLAMDVHEWHGNSKMYETPEDAAYNRRLPDIRSRDADTGVIGSQELYQRLSFVCYFREKISECDEGDTERYYREIGWDDEDERDRAEVSKIHSLPIPDRTGTLAAAQEAAKGLREVKARLTRKRTMRERGRSRKRRFFL